MKEAAELIKAIATLLWPALGFVALIIFRSQIAEVIGRIRKGKFLGQEVELGEALAKLQESATEDTQKALSEVSTKENDNPNKKDFLNFFFALPFSLIEYFYFFYKMTDKNKSIDIFYEEDLFTVNKPYAMISFFMALRAMGYINFEFQDEGCLRAQSCEEVVKEWIEKAIKKMIESDEKKIAKNIKEMKKQIDDYCEDPNFKKDAL